MISPWNPMKLAIKFRMFPLNSQPQDFCWWVFQTLFTWAIGIFHGIISPSFFLGRQEKTFEYEVKWQFKSMDSNTWVEKDHGRPWQTMADGNPTGADVWHPKHETVMVKKNRGKWTIWPSEEGDLLYEKWLRNGYWVATKRGNNEPTKMGKELFFGASSH